MRIGSSADSIYSLFLPKTKTETVSDSGLKQSAPSIRNPVAVGSEDSVVAAFQARLAQSSFNSNDTNKDGFVEKDEYISNNLKTRSDGYRPDRADVERTWNEIDKSGAGRLSEEQYEEGFSSVMVVSSGKFDKPLR